MISKTKFLILAGSAILAQVPLSNPSFAQDPIESLINNRQIEQHIQVDHLPVSHFEIIQTGTSNKAVVFVGGANDTYHYWDKHINELTCQNVTVLGYEGLSGKDSKPFNTDYLEDNAKALATGMQDLSTQGYNDIHWIAHSLGGVASLKAAHIIENNNLISENTRINLVAVNSPIGGFSAATPAMYTPLMKPISKMLNVAMAVDMSPNSDFYNSISQPLNGTINTTLIESKEDNVAQPDTIDSLMRYKEVSKTFKNVITISGDHQYSANPQNLVNQQVNIFNISQTTVKNNIEKIRTSQSLTSNTTNKVKI